MDSPDVLLGHAEPRAKVTPWGQFIGAIIMFWVLGFIPGYVLSWIPKQLNLLRVPISARNQVGLRAQTWIVKGTNKALPIGRCAAHANCATMRFCPRCAA